MNDLIRMKKLAGILTEGVMSVPGIGEAKGKRTSTIDPAEINSLAGLPHDTAMQRAQEILAASTTSDVKKQYLANQINNSRNTMGVVKLLYDMVLKGEGNGVQGSSYSRKFGEDAALPADENNSVMENGDLDSAINQSIDRLGDMLNSYVDQSQAVSTLVQELQGAGHSEENIKEILDGVNSWFGDASDSVADDTEDGHCHTCAGTGEGQHGDSSCKDCGGSGVIDNSSTDDFAEPDTGYPDDDLYEEEVDETADLNNGYDDIQFMNPGDFFPDGAASPVTSHVGPSGARQGDNPSQKKMEVAEAHKELVYNYRKFLKESAKK
jgi:hypothetical protein